MVKWYWILAAFCLMGTVGVTASTWQKVKARNLAELRKEGATDVFNERWSEAEDKLEIVVNDASAKPHDWFLYGLAVHYQGNYESAIEIFEKVYGMKYNPMLCQYNIACGYARLGNKEAALEHLRFAVSKGTVDVEWMKQDADLESLHGDPEYQEIYQMAVKRYESPGESSDPEAQPQWMGFGTPLEDTTDSP